MAGDNVEALTATIATISLTQPTGWIPVKFIDEPSSSNSLQEQVDESSGQKIARAKEAQSSNANNDDTPTNNTTHARKDSHSGNDNDDSTNNLLEINALKSEIEALKQQNKGLKKKAARYKFEMEKAHSKNCSMKKELEDKKAELAVCRQKLEDDESLFQELQSFCGMENIDFDTMEVEVDDFNFEKKYNDDHSTEVKLRAEVKVIFSKDFYFPYKTWKDKKTGEYCKDHDDGAIAVVGVSGQFYAAKCGRKQETPGTFIDKKRWTNEVIKLSNTIGKPLEWTWAQHAELQLIAFCISRLLNERGFEMVDFLSPEACQAESEPISWINIYVSQTVCDRCWGFVKKLNRATAETHRFMFHPVNKGPVQP